MHFLLFGLSFQAPIIQTFHLSCKVVTSNSQFIALLKGTIRPFISLFLKNKKHRNFNRCLDLYKNQKINQKNPERRNPHKPKLPHFCDLTQKVAIVRNASKKKQRVDTIILGSPLVDGIFLVQKMCIYSCVTLSTTLLISAVQFNVRSACDASMFTSCIYIFQRLASKCLNCTRSPEEIVQKLHKYD